jgi:hypothetical protein
MVKYERKVHNTVKIIFLKYQTALWKKSKSLIELHILQEILFISVKECATVPNQLKAVETSSSGN